jgi:hypothetical protein
VKVEVLDSILDDIGPTHAPIVATPVEEMAGIRQSMVNALNMMREASRTFKQANKMMGAFRDRMVTETKPQRTPYIPSSGKHMYTPRFREHHNFAVDPDDDYDMCLQDVDAYVWNCFLSLSGIMDVATNARKKELEKLYAVQGSYEIRCGAKPCPVFDVDAVQAMADQMREVRREAMLENVATFFYTRRKDKKSNLPSRFGKKTILGKWVDIGEVEFVLAMAASGVPGPDPRQSLEYRKPATWTGTGKFPSTIDDKVTGSKWTFYGNGNIHVVPEPIVLERLNLLLDAAMPYVFACHQREVETYGDRFTGPIYESATMMAEAMGTWKPTLGGSIRNLLE